MDESTVSVSVLPARDLGVEEARAAYWEALRAEMRASRVTAAAERQEVVARAVRREAGQVFDAARAREAAGPGVEA